MPRETLQDLLWQRAHLNPSRWCYRRATDVAAQNSTVEMLTDVPSQCSKVQSFSAGGRRLQESENHTIYLSSETVHWGYY